LSKDDEEVSGITISHNGLKIRGKRRFAPTDQELTHWKEKGFPIRAKFSRAPPETALIDPQRWTQKKRRPPVQEIGVMAIIQSRRSRQLPVLDQGQGGAAPFEQTTVWFEGTTTVVLDRGGLGLLLLKLKHPAKTNGRPRSGSMIRRIVSSFIRLKH
jgi:hypothetical protein